MRQKGSMISDLFNMDVLFGILLGIALPFVLWVATQDITVAVDKAPVQPDNAIHAYQDLIAGILALIGAAGAVFAVMKQIAHAQEMENERRLRSMYAARAMMPQALSIICRYAKECGAALRETADGVAPGDDYEWGPVPVGLFPAIPESSMPILKECAQFGDKHIQLSIAKLIQTLQVQAARLTPLDEALGANFMGRAYFYDRIDDVLEVYARADVLFPYARMETDEAPSTPTLNNMSAAAHLCGFMRQQWPELDAMIQRRYGPAA